MYIETLPFYVKGLEPQTIMMAQIQFVTTTPCTEWAKMETTQYHERINFAKFQSPKILPSLRIALAVFH